MPRSRERITVDIPVTVTTVLDSTPATIVNLTEDGALVMGVSMPAGAQVMLDVNGHSVFGEVTWSEVDRIGIRFPFVLREGPLHDALDTARSAQGQHHRPRQVAVRHGGFGRRSFN
ncbi:hypothetical protein BH10PSE12_BH10PSE12_30650 [soil metagenome]